MPPSRFAPTPFETTFKSSRQSKESDEPVTKPRHFAPELVETTQKSNKRTFSPQPIETTKYSSSSRTSTTSNGDSSSSSGKTVRKFQPDLLDTTQRSHEGSKTRQNGTDNRAIKDGLHDAAKQDTGAVAHPVPPQDQRRAVCSLDGTRPVQLALAPERQHSFRCPDLDTIESSGSERGSAGPSSRSSTLSQQSPNTASDSSFTDLYKHAARIRESVDENFNQYILRLEAKKAEERLRDQALAAFPNSDFHEPVQHFVTNDADSDDMEIEDRPVTWDAFDEDELLERLARHRKESVKIPWEQLELQRHAEKREQERQANGDADAESSKQSLWWSSDMRTDVYRQENEIRSMRDRARPPMLGRELVFPRCPSPEPARFDITQAPAVVKRMCQQSSIASSEVKSTDGGLWCSAPRVTSPPPPSTPQSTSPAKAAGLWGGFCSDDPTNPITSIGLVPPSVQTGLMTPRRDSSANNPFEQSFAADQSIPAVHTLRTPGSPPTPPESVKNLDVGNIDSILHANTLTATVSLEQEAEIVAEFPDTFVTQVYNYLSLGYPSLAQAFDEELSKISRVPVAELRTDDRAARQAPRGYIRFGPDFEPTDAGTVVNGTDAEPPMTEETCVRWKALKVYIHEWARQEKNMVNVEAAGGNWGTGARKGSWAI